MRALERARSAVFDCDGVILDSNGVKTEAFRRTLAGESPELVDRFIDYHQVNGGVSRYVKLAHFYRELKGDKDYEQAAQQAVNRFGILSLESLLDCAEILGVRDVLERLKTRDVPCFVVSGGDENEVRQVLRARGLAQMFDMILGSPTTKRENLTRIDATGRLRRPGVYFGDAASDLDAAKAYGLAFVFIAGRSEWRDGAAVCRAHRCDVLDDFTALGKKGGTRVARRWRNRAC